MVSNHKIHTKVGLLVVKTLFTRNACVCICVKRHEWSLWQQVMVFAHNVCFFRSRTAKIKDVTCECVTTLM